MKRRTLKDILDDYYYFDGGHWRNITDWSHFSLTNSMIVTLACGHKVTVRLDTAFGKSFLFTNYRALKCHQCEGTEIIPEL